MISKNLVFCLLAIVVLASCGKKQSSTSIGKSSEILVVSDSSTWQSSVGDTIRSVFMRTQDGFSNSEANFLLRYINESDFDKASHLHHNILIVDIDSDIVKGRIETLKDEWAEPQRVVKIKSASDTAFFTLLSKHAEALNELFEQNERAIARIQNAMDRNFETENFLNQELGINMVVSNAMHQTRKTNNSVCIGSKVSAEGLKLIIYTFSYKDSSQLNADNMLVIRKQYFLQNSIGIQSDNNPATFDFLSSKSMKFIFKGMYAIETRGLCKLEGKRGEIPFVSYTIIDAPRQRVVVFDGYVNNEEILKRSSIRQLESLILDAEFTFPKAKSN